MGSLVWLDDRHSFLWPISGAMGEGMGMGGNGMGDIPPPSPPGPPPPPPPPPPSPTGAVKGSVWVEGSALHWIDENGTEQDATGTSRGSPAGVLVGSMWVHTSDGSADRGLHYVDASGVDRVLFPFVNWPVAGVPPAGSIEGSIWVEDNKLSVHDGIHRLNIT